MAKKATEETECLCLLNPKHRTWETITLRDWSLIIVHCFAKLRRQPITVLSLPSNIRTDSTDIGSKEHHKWKQVQNTINCSYCPWQLTKYAKVKVQSRNSHIICVCVCLRPQMLRHQKFSNSTAKASRRDSVRTSLFGCTTVYNSWSSRRNFKNWFNSMSLM